jgi:hypothetical protein
MDHSGHVVRNKELVVNMGTYNECHQMNIDMNGEVLVEISRHALIFSFSEGLLGLFPYRLREHYFANTTHVYTPATFPIWAILLHTMQ